MTIAGRVMLGAAFGALITLLSHPASRPFLTAFTHRMSSDAIAQCLDRREKNPPPPTDVMGASLWVELGLERNLLRDAPLTAKELQTLINVTERASESERENAYWHQARAVLEWSRGDIKAAGEAWVRASRCTTWNDHQKDRLFHDRSLIAARSGAEQAWQLAYVYRTRTSSATSAIERFARTLLANPESDEPRGLLLRYATLVNGDLMRKGARSLETGQHGANIVELTAYPPDLARTPSPRRLWTGQTEFLNKMLELSHTDGVWVSRRDWAREVFSANEGWRALIPPDKPSERPTLLAMASVVTAGLPGALAGLGVIGGIIWLLGWLHSRWLGEQTKLSLPYVAGIAVLLAVLAGSLARDAWASFAPALCASCLLVSPPTVRKVRPSDLGPLFATLIFCLAGMFSITVVGYFLGRTPAANGVLPVMSVPVEYYQTPILLGIGAIFVGLLLVAAPLWAVAQRIGVSHVLGVALRRFGATLGTGGLALSILLTPVAVYADREISQSFDQLVGNEPLVYYLQ